MTQDEIAKLIPDNVREAAATAIRQWLAYTLDKDTRASDLTEGEHDELANASLAAGLAAWGGMDIDVDDPHLPPHFFLPIEEPKA